MAEAYTNKGAFQDQDQAGLSPSCAGQNTFAEECWLHESINPNAVRNINSFYLTNKNLFNLNSSSTAKIAILFSAKSVDDISSIHWSLFTKASKILSSAHLQYDVIFSEDSSFSTNSLTLEKLKHYKIIILTENRKLEDNAISLLTKYLEKGGKIIIINKVDPKLILINKTETNVANFDSDLPQDNLLLETIDKMLDKRVSENSLPKDVGIQIWLDENKTIIHLVNYDFDLNKGIIEKNNIPISINLPFKKIPISVKMLSPDFEGEQNLKFNFSDNNIQFIVPKLKVWDVLVIE